MRELCACGTQFAVGLLRCPRCRTIAPHFANRVKEEDMPRITVAAGPSNAGAAPGEIGYVEVRGERGPELVGMPEGTYLVGNEGFEGASGLTVLHEVPGEIESIPGRLELRPYTSMTLAELRQEAKEQRKPTGGSKADLIARLDGDGIGQAIPEQQNEAEEVSA